MQVERLTGSEKAAVLLLCLPEGEQRRIAEALDDGEIERILAAVSRFEEVDADIQQSVLSEFRESLGRSELKVHGGRDRAREIAETVLEGSRATRILEHLGRNERSIESTFRGYTPDFIAETIGVEHPQTIALVVSQLPAERGAEIIAALAEEIRPDVVLRLAELESVTTEVIAELEEGIALLFARPPGVETRVAGAETAAQLLNRIPKSEGSSILEGLQDRAPDIAGILRNRMLTFNDLASLQTRELQSLVREVQTDQLAIALKTASDEMREKVFGSVSKRAGDQLREEIDLLPPMRLSEVEEVQQGIVETARRLESEGAITIQVGGGDDVLV